MEVDKNQIKSWESVSKIFDPENPDRLIFQFATYGWSFPSQFRDGIHKNGITKQTINPGNKRMTEACSGKKTAIPEEPFVIPNSEIVWTIPFEISSGLLTEANKFARKFDIECNKALSSYKVKLSGQRMVGEEWYRLSVPEVTKIREKVWVKLLGRELAKKEADAQRGKRGEIKLKPGLQEAAHEAVLDQLRLGTRRFKGIAPTGFGKTVLAWKIFTDAYAQNIITGNVSIMTAPSQFLCNKNSIAFDTYNSINGIKGIVNQPIFSGQDVGVFENENQLTERRSRLEKQIEGHIKSGNKVILHVCINSMKLVAEVLSSLGIPSLDLMVVDEAHTLASHRNNGDDTYTGTIRNFCLFDENIRVSHRFFLTATEKNLINPEILNDDQNFAYMNNDELFGGYAFQYSYAECVVAGLIVPFRCKVFEYSDLTKDVVKLIATGVDRFILDDLAIRDNEGDVGQVSINLIRVLVSSIKIIEERNKMLLIVSRNTHAEVLERALETLKENPDYTFLSNVNINKITTPYYPKPEARHDELEIIHESDEKHIIICGPWAITGTDCPSIDAVLWGFNPGTEITSAQGTGRGTRTHEGKEDLLVSFNLDLQSTPSEIRDSLYRTIYKLNEGLFPSHDLELSLKVRRLIGRTFLETERDKEAVIKPEVRKLLDEFYEAAQDRELFNFVNSPAFLNGGRPDYYSFEEIHQLAAESPCESIEDFFNIYAPSLDDTRIPKDFHYYYGHNGFLEKYNAIGGARYFMGLGDSIKFRDELFKEVNDFISNCQNEGHSSRYAREWLTQRFKNLCPEIGYKDKKSGKQMSRTNPDYDPSVYAGIKKGVPLAKNTDSLYQLFRKDFGGIRERLLQYVNKEKFEEFVKSRGINGLSEFAKFYKGNKDYCIKNSIPDLTSAKSAYGEEFLCDVLPRKFEYHIWDKEKCLAVLKEIEEGIKDPKFRVQSILDRDGISTVSGLQKIRTNFKRHGIQFPDLSLRMDRIIDPAELQRLLDEGNTPNDVAKKLGIAGPTVAKIIARNSLKYISGHDMRFIHTCGAVIKTKANSKQHSRKCGCTYELIKENI
jgi:superfamily II DNA or RNA helicase